MYEPYWRLHTPPFQDAAGPAWFFAAESHRAALLKLRYALENRRGGAVLCGPSGSGKTLLTRLVAETPGRVPGPVARMIYPRLGADELLVAIASEVMAAEDPRAGAAAGWRGTGTAFARLCGFLRHRAARGEWAVVVIDDAHMIDDLETLEMLRLLMNIDAGPQPGLGLVLAGEPSLLTTLGRNPPLRDRLAVTGILRALSADETAGYVTHRLRLAGAPGQVFDPEALRAVAELSGGVPRRINHLCDLALLIGYAYQRPLITVHEVELAAEETCAFREAP